MLILAIDSSSLSACVAIKEDDRLLGEYFINIRQTHSQTLMPMIESIIELTGKSVVDFDIIAAACGPGSFTGVRIGIASAKGLALSADIPCVPVSTLEAMAYSFRNLEGRVICAVMDARREQVYNGLFRIENGTSNRLCDDRAISITELARECSEFGNQLLLTGDGAEICCSTGLFEGEMSQQNLRFTKASAIADIAHEQAKMKKTVRHGDLRPVYLRASQAERELKLRGGLKI